MTFKRFGPEDLVYNTLVTKPEFDFIINSGSVYRNSEILPSGDFGNTLKHIENGEVSFHELNVNRPSGSLVYGFINKETTRYAFGTITSGFDDSSQFQYGNALTQSYPLKAGLTRIYVEEGPEFDDVTFDPYEPPSFAGSNKKYIRALKNVINSRENLGKQFNYGDLGTSNVNMICVPGIFYGSKMDPGTVELSCYITGSLIGQLKDTNKDGVLLETTGPESGSVAGVVIYEQGLMLLTGSWDLSSGAHTDTYGVSTYPNWLSFGTGLNLIGAADEGGANFAEEVETTSYRVNFKGTNKIPTLTMFSYAEKGEYNFSNNPSFLELTNKTDSFSSSSYSQPTKKIKNITQSRYENHSASFESTTYISKVGIYDENKNLIAIATLANPLKKTPNRDYMIKMRMDF